MEEIAEYKPLRDWEFKKSELSSRQKREARAFLWGLRGEKNCCFCKEPLNPRYLHNTYTIHHELTLGLLCCNMLVVLHLAHASCNSKEGRAKGIKKEREKEILRLREVKSPTELLRERVNFSEGDTSQKINDQSEVPFIGWIRKQLVLKGHMEYKDALDRGAYFTGVGQQAIRRYLDKMIAGEEIECKKDPDSRKRMLKLSLKGEERFLAE